MAYSIFIRQKNGNFKTTPDYAALQKQFTGVVKIGGIGRYFDFEPKPGPPEENWQAAYMLYGVGSPLGRGFYLYVEKDYASFEIATALPTTTHDLEDMFIFAEQLAKFLGQKEVHDSSGTYPRAFLPKLYPEVLKNNLEMLKSQAISRPGFTVSGVRYPVQIPNLMCGRIAGVPLQNAAQFFSACLEDKQRLDVEYLKPTFYRDEATGEARGRYDIREDTGYILPRHPFIPYGPSPFAGEEITGWQMSLVSTQLGPLGTLPPGVFLERLTKHEQRDFDERHIVMLPLRLQRLQQILEEA